MTERVGVAYPGRVLRAVRNAPSLPKDPRGGMPRAQLWIGMAVAFLVLSVLYLHASAYVPAAALLALAAFFGLWGTGRVLQLKGRLRDPAPWELHRRR